MKSSTMQESESSPSNSLQIFSRRERTFEGKIADPDEANPKVGWLNLRRRDFFRID